MPVFAKRKPPSIRPPPNQEAKRPGFLKTPYICSSDRLEGKIMSILRNRIVFVQFDPSKIGLSPAQSLNVKPRQQKDTYA